MNSRNRKEEEEEREGGGSAWAPIHDSAPSSSSSPKKQQPASLSLSLLSLLSFLEIPPILLLLLLLFSPVLSVRTLSHLGCMVGLFLPSTSLSCFLEVRSLHVEDVRTDIFPSPRTRERLSAVIPRHTCGSKTAKIGLYNGRQHKRGGGIFHHPSGISFHGGKEANFRKRKSRRRRFDV